MYTTIYFLQKCEPVQMFVFCVDSNWVFLQVLPTIHAENNEMANIDMFKLAQ